MEQRVNRNDEQLISQSGENESVMKKVLLAGLGAVAISAKMGNQLIKGQSRASIQPKEDWNRFIPNLVEAAVAIGLTRIHERGLLGGTLDVLQLPLDLFRAAYYMPTPIQAAAVALLQTAQQTLDLTQRHNTVACNGIEQELVPSSELKELLQAFLEVSDKALDLLGKCPPVTHYSPALGQHLTRGFSLEVAALLKLILETTRRLYQTYSEDIPDPVFVHDAYVFAGIVQRYSAETPVLPGDVGYGDPNFLLRTVVGTPDSWFRQGDAYSELKTVLIDPEEAQKSAKSATNGREATGRDRYLQDVWLGVRLADDVKALRIWQGESWQRANNTKVKVPDQEIGKAQEFWFYINGICTDHYLAQLNAEYLAQIFKRRIHILHNETEGFYRDLQECVSGRVQNNVDRSMVDVMTGLLLTVKGALLDQDVDSLDLPKVVIIAHSQGTILIASVVKALFSPAAVKTVLNVFLKRSLPVETKKQVEDLLDLSDSELEKQLDNLLRKMEVFSFANCTDEFERKTIPADGGRSYPQVIEHFVNEHDLVALLSPQDQYGFAGEVFKRKGAWGHLLNIHYLDGFIAGAYQAQVKGRRSTLMEYLKQAGNTARSDTRHRRQR